MLQPIKKTLFSCASALTLAAVSLTAAAQQSSSQPQTTAAPGTVAITPQAAAALTPYVGPKYDNRWEVYGGLSFMNGQAGQTLNKRYNMGGVEVMGTYWLGPNALGGHVSKLGIVADYRFEAGTTPVNAIGAAYGLNRVVVIQNVFMGGVQYRGPKNRYAAVDFHALAGGTDGIFDYATTHYPGGSVPQVSSCPTNGTPGQIYTLGLYCNHVAPIGAIGGSIDFNESPKLAIRLSPDMIFEHFGTETREFFSISAGAIYRFGKTDKAGNRK